MKEDRRVVNTDLEAVMGGVMLLILGAVGSSIGVLLYIVWLAIWGPA